MRETNTETQTQKGREGGRVEGKERERLTQTDSDRLRGTADRHPLLEK